MTTPAAGFSLRRAVVPGSFDPFTRGHLDLVDRALRLFDEVVVAVGHNSAKGRSGLFSPAERMELITQACAERPSVGVASFSGLLVDFCTERGAIAVVKGLRSGSDLDHELPMAQMNAALTGVETVLLPTAPSWSYVSSSLVREVALLGGDVSAYLPEVVAAAVVERVRARTEA